MILAAVRLCDERRWGFGWIAPEPASMERCSHAVAAGGRVWLFDVVDADGLDDRVRALGEPAGVVQLLGRHARDSASVAVRLGVPLHAVPAELPASPFRVVPVLSVPGWREVAVWWPDERVLVCGDALGTAPYFRAPGDNLAVHPLLRLRPPRSLAALEPAHVLCGHGEGMHCDDAAEAVRQALRTARRRLPAAWLASARAARRG
jgi:hypothetical protein